MPEDRLRRALQSESERQVIVCCQRALQVETVATTARRTFDNQSLCRNFSPQSEIEAIVGREIAGADIRSRSDSRLR